MQENGDFSDIAQKAFIAASGSYAEKSVSGKGLHIFGKTKVARKCRSTFANCAVVSSLGARYTLS